MAHDGEKGWAQGYLADQKKRKPPAFLYLEKLRAMRWVSGEEMTEAERAALVNLLRREDDKNEVEELRRLRPLLHDDDCSRWSEYIEKAWKHAGHEPKNKWAVYQLGVLGDDARVDVVALGLPALADQNYWRRATWYLDAFHRLGTRRARSWIFDLFCHAPMKGSVQRHSGELIADAIRREGVAEDVFVRSLDLHVRQTWDEEHLEHPDITPNETTVRAGGRDLVVLMDAEFTTGLRDPATGARVRELGEGTEGHDAFEAIRARIDAFVAEWSSHLEQAMVSARPFTITLLRERFLSEPIMARLIETLVWRTSEGATLRFVDGEPFDHDYDPVALSPEDILTLPHPVEMPAQDRSAWGNHLADAELTQVFEQLNRPMLTPENAPIARALRVDGVDMNSAREALSRAGWRGSFAMPYETGHMTFHDRRQRAWATFSPYAAQGSETGLQDLHFTDLWNSEVRVEDVDPVVYSEALGAASRFYAAGAEFEEEQ